MTLFSHFHVTFGQLLKVLGILMLAAASTVRAEIIAVEIPSELRNSEAEQGAILSGFGQVLVKITGNPDILDNKALMDELGDPEIYLSSYWDKPVSDVEPPEGWIYVVEFDADGLRPLLEGHINISALAMNSVDAEGEGASTEAIVWMLIEPANVGSFILGGEESLTGDWAAVVDRLAQEAGFDLLLPLMDMQEISTVTPTLILDADDNALRLAAARYPVSSTIVAVATQDDGGNWFARMHQAGLSDQEVYGDSDSFESAVSLALSDLALQVGVSATTVDTSIDAPPGVLLPVSAETSMVDDITDQVDYVDVSTGSILIDVSGVKGYGDYRKIIQYLSADSHVASVLPKGSGSGSAKFELQLNGSSSGWLAAISQSPEAILQQTAMPEHTDLSHSQYYFTLK